MQLPSEVGRLPTQRAPSVRLWPDANFRIRPHSGHAILPFLRSFHPARALAKSLPTMSCSSVQLRENGCMKERTSKQLLFVETAIFLVPVSLLTGLYALFLIPMYVSGGLLKEPLEAHTAPTFTLVGLILQLCGWRVIAAFLIDGRQGIRRSHRSTCTPAFSAQLPLPSPAWLSSSCWLALSARFSVSFQSITSLCLHLCHSST